MNNNSTSRTVKNIVKVSISNILKLLAGILVGFALPKIIGVSDYGYYKTFTLYATYIGLFHFGISDGIYLKFGGKSIEELDKNKFRAYTKFFFILEIFIGFLIALVAIFFLRNDSKFIFISLSIYLISYNIIGYFQIISQVTSRFNELSIRNVVQSLLSIISIVILWIIYRFSTISINYKVYLYFYLFIFLVLAIWYCFTYRSLIFGTSCSLLSIKTDIIHLAKLGIPLLISNLCCSLLLVIDRQFVNLLFDNDTYAIYAFAYNMLSLITIAMSAISTVLYPTLKNESREKIISMYPKLNSIILILVFLSLSVYFPLIIIINYFLPQYIDSIQIFRIILPSLAFTSLITIIMHNFYKVDNRNKQFLLKSLITLALSIIANFIAYYIFKTTISISIASIFIMVIWFILIEALFVFKYKINEVKNYLYLIISCVAFYLITIIDIWYIGFIVYLLFILIFTFFMYIKDIKYFINLRLKDNSD